MPGPPGTPSDERYRQRIQQRQALARRIDELIALETRLETRRAEVERQVALSASQEHQARAAGREDQARLAQEHRQRLATHLPTIQQQLEQVRLHMQAAMEQERHISAELDAVFRQQATPPVSAVAPGGAWQQMGVNRPARRVPQE